jgi:hypothetical protein
MAGNYKLKQECKTTLNAIRDLLSQVERERVEPHLRQILEVTKVLVNNAKVSPEEHEALAAEVKRLSKERRLLNESIATLRRDVEKSSKLKDTAAKMEIANGNLQELLTEMVCGGLQSFISSSFHLMRVCGDSEIVRWFTESKSVVAHDPTGKKTLFAMCLVVMCASESDETVTAIVSALCDAVSNGDGTRARSDKFKSCFEAVFGQKVSSTESSEVEWWWLAVNGASCAASLVQARAADLEVAPVPEQMIGFRTREEQTEVQQFLLKAPIEEVNQYMASLGPRIASGEIAYLRPRNPEPPTRGPTMWHFKRHNDAE